jgi:hypothetical protein
LSLNKTTNWIYSYGGYDMYNPYNFKLLHSTSTLQTRSS